MPCICDFFCKLTLSVLSSWLTEYRPPFFPSYFSNISTYSVGLSIAVEAYVKVPRCKFPDPFKISKPNPELTEYGIWSIFVCLNIDIENRTSLSSRDTSKK